MRIHICFTSKTGELIPFNYQSMLTTALHKWIRKNAIHDDVSLYSFSWLMGAEATNAGLRFRENGRFFISSFHRDILKKIVKGIQLAPSIGYGLIVKEMIIQEDPKFKNEHTFFCASPVLVKRKIDEREIHFTYEQEEADQYVTETLRTKLKKVALPTDNISVQFDRNYHSPKTKVIYYNNIGNRVNMCPVRIKGTPEQLAFAWNVGIGNSTGIGFGALK